MKRVLVARGGAECWLRCLEVSVSHDSHQLPHPPDPYRWPSNLRLQRTALCAAAEPKRVYRAWHKASEVKVLTPGFRGAEGWEQGKVSIVRWWLKEAQSNTAGRRTGTQSEVWYTWDERARDREVLYPQPGCAL